MGLYQVGLTLHRCGVGLASQCEGYDELLTYLYLPTRYSFKQE